MLPWPSCRSAFRSGYVNAIVPATQSLRLSPVAYALLQMRAGALFAVASAVTPAPLLPGPQRLFAIISRAAAPCRAPSCRMSDPSQPAELRKPSSRAPLLSSGALLRSLWLAAAFGVFLFLGWMLLATLWEPRLDWFAVGRGTRVLFYYGCLDGFALALSAAFLCGLEGRRFRDLGLSFAPGWLLQMAVGMAWGAAVISSSAFLLVVSRAAAVFPFASRSLSRLLFLSAFLLLSSTFEELTFRGYALQRAADALGPVLAALISSALFGWAHFANPQATLFSTVNTALAGLILAIARLRSRALWMPIGLHFAWNFFLGPVFSFPVSGYTFGSSHVPSPAAGPLWFSGGAYGPEGSVALTAVLAVAIPLLLLLPVPGSSLRTRSGVN
jgi:membrane protease YdiL (CAAX protease family)